MYRYIAGFEMASQPAQLGLSLRTSPTWGGARAGAGRKRGANSRMAHTKRVEFRKSVPAHVTLRIRSDCASLRTVPIVREIERSFASGCDRPGFRLVHYSLQGNHAHMIVEADDQWALGRGMKAIGARIARAVNRIARRTGRVLADRYHMRLLPTPREVRNALRYVLLNARHHLGRPARRMGEVLDPASSARWFDGWKSGERTTPSAPESAAGRVPSPVARARTWLLSIGWRRHGLLDPADIPG